MTAGQVSDYTGAAAFPGVSRRPMLSAEDLPQLRAAARGQPGISIARRIADFSDPFALVPGERRSQDFADSPGRGRAERLVDRETQEDGRIALERLRELRHPI